MDQNAGGLPPHDGHRPLTHNFQTEFAPMEVESPGENRNGDVEMYDITGSDASTKDSYQEDFDDEETWSEIETEDEGGPRSFDSERGVLNSKDMGAAIEYSFPVPLEYSEQHHMFDDGVSEYDSGDESDASANYEELDEPDVRAVKNMVPMSMSSKKVIDDEDVDETYHDDESDLEEGHEDESQNDDEIELSDDPDATYIPNTGLDHTSTSEAVEDFEQSSLPQTLDQLQRADILLQEQEKFNNQRKWKLLELQEALRRLQEEIPIAEFEVDRDEQEIQEETQELLANMEVSGLSPELFEAYKAFCESLHPEFGLREGFSITCDQSHNNSYVDYDPDFHIFKECVEMDWSSCNWRCEASNEDRGKVVEFWPIAPPGDLDDESQTWGTMHPTLYNLLSDAANSGSLIAREILARVPERNASSAGGWLFDYQFEPLLSEEPMVSRRWMLRGSHLLGPRYEETGASSSRSS